ncbi:MAG: hypothetical protein JXA10_19480, partial [Anaerolineae bacterium]|nr:hypothetical protein [Anaerolineae bacterium]
MNWQKIWLVIRHEYLTNFRRPSFLFTAFGVPVFSLGAMFLLTQFIVNRETNLDDWQRIAYIDRAHMVDDSLDLGDCDCDYTAIMAAEDAA